jgi:Tol biopolymer transport system component
MRVFLILIVFFCAVASHAQEQTAISYSGIHWSPDGNWIAFSRMEIIRLPTMKIDADIYLVHPDGTGLRRVTGDGQNEFNPVFTKDGKSLVFASTNNVTQASDIFMMKIDGSELRQITANVYHAASPEISPDGKWIVFNATMTAGPSDHFRQIYIMRSDGSGIKQVTKDGSISSYSPVWMSDGKRIVYCVERGDGKDQIWSMRSDGTDQRLLTANIGSNFYPSPTKSGRILFVSSRNDKQEFYTMNPDGSDVKAIGPEALSGRQSPNGSQLAYIAGRLPDMFIYIADANGAGARKLLR